MRPIGQKGRNCGDGGDHCKQTCDLARIDKGWPCYNISCYQRRADSADKIDLAKQSTCSPFVHSICALQEERREPHQAPAPEGGESATRHGVNCRLLRPQESDSFHNRRGFIFRDSVKATADGLFDCHQYDQRQNDAGNAQHKKCGTPSVRGRKRRSGGAAPRRAGSAKASPACAQGRARARRRPRRTARARATETPTTRETRRTSGS